MDNIMKLFVDKLNDNTLGLLYEGNFLFQFHDESLTVLSQETGKLVYTESEYSPVAMQLKEPTPFAEKNGRIDWLIEFNILTRVAGQKYDETIDLDYENIKAKLALMNGLYVSDSGKKYVFKTRPPKDLGYVTIGKSKYIIISCVMNTTELTAGFFGQNSVVTVTYGTTVMTPDVIEFGKVSTRRYYQGDKKEMPTNDYNLPTGRVVAFTLKINYRDETLLLDEVSGKSALNAKYTLKEVFNTSRTDIWTVSCEQASEIESVNGVKKLSFQFKETL